MIFSFFDTNESLIDLEDLYILHPKIGALIGMRFLWHYLAGDGAGLSSP